MRYTHVRLNTRDSKNVQINFNRQSLVTTIPDDTIDLVNGISYKQIQNTFYIYLHENSPMFNFAVIVFALSDTRKFCGKHWISAQGVGVQIAASLHRYLHNHIPHLPELDERQPKGILLE